MICQWQADQLFAKAKGWGKLLICETVTNHNILWWPSSIIVLSLDQQVCFLNSQRSVKRSAILPQSDRKKDKSRILLVAKHSWTTLLMSRSLFVGSYLQVTWWKPGALNMWNLGYPVYDCVKEGRFSSCPRAKVRRQRPPGSDRTLACMFMVARENPWVSVLDNSLV